MPLIDILDYMIPSAQMMQESHLVGTLNPSYTIVKPNRIIYIKNQQGFPWDVNAWDSNYVYQLVTEVSWTDPKQRKQFTIPNWPLGGLPLCPRFFDPNTPSTPIVISQPSYQIFSDCSTSKPSSLGQGETKLSGPFQIDFQGDLGVQETMLVEWLWGTGLKNLERFYYAKGFGWVKWDLSLITSMGIYMVQKTNLMNIVAPGITNLNFPCALP